MVSWQRWPSGTSIGNVQTWQKIKKTYRVISFRRHFTPESPSAGCSPGRLCLTLWNSELRFEESSHGLCLVKPGTVVLGTSTIVRILRNLLQDRGLSVVGWVTILEMWLAAVTFLVMTAANVTAVCHECDQRFTVPVAAFATLLLCFVPPKIFSYLSMLSALSMVFALAALVVAAFSIGVDHWEIPQGEQAYLDPWNLPRSIGIITFCFAGHPVFPSVHSSMKTRSKWNNAVNISFAAAFAYYGIFGFLGYLVFGRHADPTITNNLQACRTFAA
eukprot:1744608-Amphidinium_carterae.1